MAKMPRLLTRFRMLPATAAVGLAGAALLATASTGTLSGFTAAITDGANTNTAASGALVMQEQNAAASVTCTSTDSTTVSTNSASCSSINKFGGSTTMVPGSSSSTSITIKNIGTSAAGGFTLTPGSTCTQGTNGSYNGSATDFCSKLSLVITSGSTTVYTGTLAGFAGAAASAMTMPAAPAAGVTVPFTFTVSLASTAGNTYQGLSATVPMTWTFTS